VRVAYHLFPQTPGQEIDNLRRWIGWSAPATATAGCAPTAPVRTSPGARRTSRTSPSPEQLTNRAAGELEEAARLLLEHGWGFRLHATYN